MNQSGQQEISARPETKMAFKPEYVGCFSLCPAYSIKQLRRINYIQHKYRHGKRSPLDIGFYRNVPIHTQLDIKQAFSEAERQHVDLRRVCVDGAAMQ
jgi:hypothetical protein